MKREGRTKLLILIVFSFLLSGCAHAISSQMREKAREDLAFSRVAQNPEAFEGETAIWGGKIIETTNYEGYTIIKILQIPLDSMEMPGDEEHSQGRFLARVDGYVDKEIYKEGRKMTVAGKVVGKEVQALGQTQYAYPVVRVEEMHLWRKEPRYEPYYDPYWDFGYPGPFWGPFYPYWRFHR